MSSTNIPLTGKPSFFSGHRFKQLITILVLCGVGYGVYAYFFKAAPTTTRITLTQTVKLGSIENSINTIGTANLINEQKIRFNQLGKVSGLSVKE